MYLPRFVFQTENNIYDYGVHVNLVSKLSPNGLLSPISNHKYPCGHGAQRLQSKSNFLHPISKKLFAVKDVITHRHTILYMTYCLYGIANIYKRKLA